MCSIIIEKDYSTYSRGSSRDSRDSGRDGSNTRDGSRNNGRWLHNFGAIIFVHFVHLSVS